MSITTSSAPRPKAAKAVAIVAAVAALAFGAAEISKSHSSSATTSAAAAPGARVAPNGPPGGFGTPVTGATLIRLKAVATARYPGTVEQAMQLPDGSYVVHVIQTSGTEMHVLVSRDLKVTGTQQGPPTGAPQGAAPQGAAPPRTS